MASLTIELPDVAERTLRRQAAAAGKPVEQLASEVLQAQASAAARLDQVGSEVYGRFAASGMTDAELAEVLEKEDHEARGVPYDD